MAKRSGSPSIDSAAVYTRYDLLSRDVMEAIEAMMAEVPKLSPKERRNPAFVRTYAGISPEFVFTTAKGVEFTPDLARMQEMNVAAAYSSRQLTQAFQRVVYKLIAAAEELQTVLDTRQANAAFEALKVYAIVKAMASRRKTDFRLKNLLKVMKKDLGSRGPGKKKRGAAAAAPPARKRPRRRLKTRSLGEKLLRRVER